MCKCQAPSPPSPVLGSDVGHDVLIEELEDERDAVGKHQVLGHVLKLRPKTRQAAEQAAPALTPSAACSPGKLCPVKVPTPAHLVDVIQFEVLEEQQQDSRDGLDNDLFVAIHIHPQLHTLQHRGSG